MCVFKSCVHAMQSSETPAIFICRKEVVPQIVFYFILEDFVFYWGHRILHTKWLYQHVHSVHHEWVGDLTELYTSLALDMHFFFGIQCLDCCTLKCRYATPFGLTSEYAHPAEILFLGFATIVGPAITGPHLFTLWLWMVLRVLETVEAHCGYHFPWSPSNFIPLYGGWEWILFCQVTFIVVSVCPMMCDSICICSSDFHDYHHRLLYTKSGNYSSTFMYMDW